jgi:hypothetical protein
MIINITDVAAEERDGEHSITISLGLVTEYATATREDEFVRIEADALQGLGDVSILLSPEEVAAILTAK